MAKQRMMKAVRIEEYVKDLNEISTTLVPIPTFPPSRSKPSNSPLLLIRVTHTSPTHVDTLYARGLHQNNHSRLVHPPFTLGLEFAGVIVDIYPPPSSATSTSKCHLFQKGDKVWGTHPGTFTTYLITISSQIHHIPSTLTPFQAAALGASTAPVSYGALIRLGQLQRGETALIHAAAGGLGVAAVRIAKAIGANVIATVGSAEKQTVIENMLRNPRTGLVDAGNGVVRYDTQDWEKQVLELSSESKGVHVVFDTVGLVRKSIRCCRFGGRIVIVGFVGLQGKEMESVPMNRILLKGVRVLGYRFGETGRRDPEESRRTWEGFRTLCEGVEMKKGGDGDVWGMEPVVYKTYKGLEHVNEAIGELASRKVYGKIVIEVEGDEENENENGRVDEHGHGDGVGKVESKL